VRPWTRKVSLLLGIPVIFLFYMIQVLILQPCLGLSEHPEGMLHSYRCLTKHGYGLQESMVAECGHGQLVPTLLVFRYLCCFYMT
jgi:hypothetical protein